MKRIALFLLITTIAISSAGAQKVKRSKKIEKDGFRWYLLEQGDLKGAEIKKKEMVIPLEKQYIHYYFGYLQCNIGEHKALYDTSGTLIIPIERKYTETIPLDGCIYVHFKYTSNDSLRYGIGICDLQGNEIVPTSRKYRKLHRNSDGAHHWYQVYDKDYKQGVCDNYGEEIITPHTPGNLDIVYLENTFSYIDTNWVQHYLGMRLDANGHGIPDPQHPEGATRQLEQPIQQPTDDTKATTYADNYRTTQYSATNNTYNNSYSNSYNNTHTPTPSYNNTYTPKQNSTTRPQTTAPAPEKCKSCLGSGQCRGYGSVQSIKMHCNASGRCSTCGGRGLMSTGFGSQTKCSYCNGSGKCQYCKGTGKCDRCNGTGTRKY